MSAKIIFRIPELNDCQAERIKRIINSGEQVVMQKTGTVLIKDRDGYWSKVEE